MQNNATLNDFSTGTNIAQDYAKALRAAFAEWTPAYIDAFPPPVMQAFRSLLSWYYWDLWAQAFLAFCGFLLTGLRTAPQFYKAGFADHNNVILAGAEAALAVLVVDLGLLVFAAIIAYRRLAKETAGLEDANMETINELIDERTVLGINVSRVKYNTVIMILAATVMIAGLGQSLGIDETLNAQYGSLAVSSLVVLMGAGIGIVTLLIGDMFGDSIATIMIMRRRAQLVYESQMQEWNDERQQAWEDSEILKSLQRQFNMLDIQNRKSMKGQIVTQSRDMGEPQTKQYTQMDLVKIFLNGKHKAGEIPAPDAIPGIQAIKRTMDATPQFRKHFPNKFSTSSITKARKQWAREVMNYDIMSDAA